MCSWQDVSTDVVRDTRHLCETTHELSSTLKSVKENKQLYVQPPEGWTPKLLHDGRRVVWKVRKAMLCLRTSPRRCQEHLSNKLKERGFIQHEHICIGVHVDDVGPSESTTTLLRELAKDMAMRWGMVTDKPREFMGGSLCRTPRGYNCGVPYEYVTQLCKDFGSGQHKSFEKIAESNPILDDAGQRRHRQLLGRLL